jgi:hypothetical protein
MRLESQEDVGSAGSGRIEAANSRKTNRMPGRVDVGGLIALAMLAHHHDDGHAAAGSAGLPGSGTGVTHRHQTSGPKGAGRAGTCLSALPVSDGGVCAAIWRDVADRQRLAAVFDGGCQRNMRVGPTFQVSTNWFALPTIPKRYQRAAIAPVCAYAIDITNDRRDS